MVKTISGLPHEYWRTEDACRILSQQFATHMAALLVVYKTDETTHHVLYSGFLYRHQGIPLWITAGHVLSGLDRLRERGVEIVKAEWLDLVDDGSRHGIPVDLQELPYIPVDKHGVDFGFVLLGRYYEELFKGLEGNVFLDEQGYFRRENAQPEGFYLIGFPSERHEVLERTVGERAEYSLDAPLYCLPLEQIPDRPGDEPATFWGCKGCLYFQIVPFDKQLGPQPKDISFMSGGPIVSIERTPEGRMKYYLFGVQGSWLDGQRIIRATDSESIGAIIDELFKRMREAAPPERAPKGAN